MGSQRVEIEDEAVREIPQAGGIEEASAQLDGIIAWAKAHKNRCGYFAALYRKVTIKVREGIESSFFDDGPRMTRFLVLFTNRYLTSFQRFHSGMPVWKSWQIAFEAAENGWLIALQHLFLGMNAHINFDLPLAAVQTAPGSELRSLKNDFYKMNGILASLVLDVQKELEQIWPALRLLSAAPGEVHKSSAGFSLALARDHAWKTAESLSEVRGEMLDHRLQYYDSCAERMGRLILHPGLQISLANKLIRMTEQGSVPRKIDILLQA